MSEFRGFWGINKGWYLSADGYHPLSNRNKIAGYFIQLPR